jgi:hypothetical protein
MQQYLSGAAQLQDSQQRAGAGGNSRLSLKLLIVENAVAARASPMLKDAAARLVAMALRTRFTTSDAVGSGSSSLSSTRRALALRAQFTELFFRLVQGLPVKFIFPSSLVQLLLGLHGGLVGQHAPRFEQHEPGCCLRELAAQVRIKRLGLLHEGEELAGDGRDGQVLHRVFVLANQVEQQVKGSVKVGQSDDKLHICVELHLSVCYRMHWLYRDTTFDPMEERA